MSVAMTIVWPDARVACIPDGASTRGDTVSDVPFVPIRLVLVPLLSFDLADCP